MRTTGYIRTSLVNWLLVPAIIIAFGACDSSPLDPVTYEADGIRATVSRSEVRITNETGERISYMVMEAEWAALALISLSGWPTIEPFGEVVLRYTDIPGYEPGRANEVLIDWAPAPASPGGPVNASSIKVLKVPLQ